MRRRLSPEEQALWDRVRASAVPLRPGPPVAPASPQPPPQPAPQPAPVPRAPPPPLAPEARPPLPAFRIGEKADHRGRHDLLPGLAESLGRLPVRMDAGTHARMRKGKLRPEARIDLHGMTAAEAHGALVPFLLASRAAGRRLVLVITGKGQGAGRGGGRDDLWPMPRRAGRLRHEVPRWLMLPPLRDAVLQIAPAHPRHGGEGALYVYLRAP
jgi:DNA-nicking Smr family endonuclease